MTVNILHLLSQSPGGQPSIGLRLVPANALEKGKRFLHMRKVLQIDDQVVVRHFVSGV